MYNYYLFSTDETTANRVHLSMLYQVEHPLLNNNMFVCFDTVLYFTHYAHMFTNTCKTLGNTGGSSRFVIINHE